MRYEVFPQCMRERLTLSLLYAGVASDSRRPRGTRAPGTNDDTYFPSPAPKSRIIDNQHLNPTDLPKPMLKVPPVEHYRTWNVTRTRWFSTSIGGALVTCGICCS